MTACTKDQTLTDQLLRISYISNVDNIERDFFLYLPNGYSENPHKRWPVMLFLHGNGERGNGKDELDYVLIHGPLYEAWVQKRHLPFIIISPQLHMFGMDIDGSDYLKSRTRDFIPRRLEHGVPDRPAESEPVGSMDGVTPRVEFENGVFDRPKGWSLVEQDLIYILDSVLENYNTDTKRIYLTGLSYGGFGTWYLASKHPERFAAIAPIVGWGHPDLMEPIARYKIPVWSFAAGRDPLVSRLENHFAGLNKLEKLGHKDVMFTVHEDMGHDAWKRIYKGEDIYNWLLSKSLD
jgi:predicted peptidase